jgi:flagellar biosynthesis/type III secretory pathway protein FliH
MLKRCEVWSPQELLHAMHGETAVLKARQDAARRIRNARARSAHRLQEMQLQASAQSQEDCAKALSSFIERLNSLTEAYCRDLASAFSFAFEVALKTKAYPEWINFCVNKVRHEVDSTDFLQLRVHPEMFAVANDALAQLNHSNALSVKITVRSDSTVMPGETVVASDAGLFSVQLSPFLKNLEQVLEKSLMLDIQAGVAPADLEVSSAIK